MGIQGQNLAANSEGAVKCLHLEERIDVKKAKKEFTEDTRSLEKNGQLKYLTKYLFWSSI